MRLRVQLFFLCFLAFLTMTVAAQFGPPIRGIRDLPPGAASDRASTLITGTCYGVDGMPVGGVTVELRDPATNAIIATTTTRSSGSFELYNMPAGSYELLARAQGNEAREFIPAGRMVARVELRMARGTSSAGGGGPAVSVARLKVPEKARDRYNKAAQAFLRGKLDQAEKVVNQSLAIYGDNPDALTLRGMIALQNRDTKAALEDFQKSIDVDQSYVPAYTAMSSVLNSEGKYDEAARTTERAVAVNPNAWQGYFEMAKAMLGKGLYQKALEVANRAEKLAPSGIAGIHLLKAYALVPLKLYKDAGNELQAFLSHAPKGQDTSGVKSLLAQVRAAETGGDPNAVPAFAVVSH